MTAAIIQFALSSFVIVVAATLLTRFADAIAQATGLGHLIVGSVLLATATSLPELSVNWAVVKLGLPNMAVGGLVGSSLFNLGILAVADLSHKERGLMFSRRSLENALPGVVSIGMISLVGVGIFVGDRVDSLEFGGLGLFTIALLVSYLLGLRMIYHDQRIGLREAVDPVVELNVAIEPSEDMRQERRIVAVRAALGFIVTAVVIVVVAPYSASAAGTIASASGLGTTFIGTTLVAAATSLPEFVACIAAVRMGAMNLAVGNVFGSNIFNLVLLIPLDFAFDGPLLGAVSMTHLLTCLLVVLVTAVVILGGLYRIESRTLLIEPDAGLILLLVVGGLALVYFCK